MLADGIGLTPSPAGQRAGDVSIWTVCGSLGVPENPYHQVFGGVHDESLASGLQSKAVDLVHVLDDGLAEQLRAGRLEMYPVVGPDLFV